jgi:hypothetical protein
VHQPVEEDDLPLVLVERRAEDDAHVLLVQRLGGTRQDLGEVARVDLGNGDADQARAAARQGTGGAVLAEAVLADDAQHGVAGRVGDVRVPVQDARHRGERDAGQRRDVLEGARAGGGRLRHGSKLPKTFRKNQPSLGCAGVATLTARPG